MDLAVPDCREALRLLIQGLAASDPMCVASPEDRSELKTRATRILFRLIVRFAEEETASDPSTLRRALAKLADSVMKKDQHPSLFRFDPDDRAKIKALSTQCLTWVSPANSKDERICPLHLLLAADRLSRGSGPLGGRIWTDFRIVIPRDFGRIYEGLSGVEPELQKSGEGGVFPSVRLHMDTKGRKASGSFYTPEPITRRIVESALDPLLKPSSSPSLSLRVLDPAMGCGYFLLAAAERLCEQYGVMSVEAGRSDGRALRRIIAEDCLYGVDKDPVAVDLARLAVSAWVAGKIVSQPLPSLEAHLRCGDSLMGSCPGDPPDSDANRASSSTLSHRLFHWEAEFPQVFSRSADEQESGFDAVTGNPPYDNSRGGLAGQPEFERVARYARASGQYRVRGAVDLYRLFLQRSLRLCRRGGIVSMIVPRTLLGDRDATGERRMLLEETEILQIDDFPYDDAPRRVFPAASLAASVVTARKGGETDRFPIRQWPDGGMTKPPATTLVRRRCLERFWPQSIPFAGLSGEEESLLRRLDDAPWVCPLSEVADGAIGEANSGYHKAFMVDEETGYPLIRGIHVTPYRLKWSGARKSCLDHDGFLASLSPAARENLKWGKTRIVKQAVSNLSHPKRIIAAIAPPGVFLADSTDYFVARPPYDPRYVLALLNSRTLPEWLFRKVSTNNNVNLYQVRDLPVPRVRFITPEPERTRAVEEGWTLLQKADYPSHAEEWNEWLTSWLQTEDSGECGVSDVAHDLLVRLAQEMIDLKKRESERILEEAGEVIARRCKVERWIDALIWRMYGLTDMESEMIRSTLPPQR